MVHLNDLVNTFKKRSSRSVKRMPSFENIPHPAEPQNVESASKSSSATHPDDKLALEPVDEEMDSLRLDYQILADDLVQKQEAIVKLVRESEEQASARETLESQIAGLNSEHQADQAAVGALKSQLETLQSEYNQLSAISKESELKLQQYIDEKQRADAALHFRETELSTLKHEIEILATDLLNLQASEEKAQSALAAERTHSRDAEHVLAAEIKQLSEQVQTFKSEAQQRIQALLNETETYRLQIKQLRTEIDSARDLSHNLTHSLDESRAQSAKHKADLESKAAELVQVRQELLASQSSSATLVSDAQASLESLHQDQLMAIQAELDQSEQARRALQSAVDDSKAKIEALRHELAGATARAAKDRNLFQQEQAAHDAKVGALTAALSKHESEKSVLNEMIVEHKSLCEKSKAEASALQQKVSSLSGECEQHQAKLTEQDIRTKDLVATVEKLESEISDKNALIAQLRTVEESYRCLETKHAEMRDQHSRCPGPNEIQAAIDEQRRIDEAAHASTIQELERQHKQATDRLSAAHQQAVEDKAASEIETLAAMKQRIEELEKRNTVLETHAATLEDSYKAKVSSLEASQRQKLSELEASIKTQLEQEKSQALAQSREELTAAHKQTEEQRSLEHSRKCSDYDAQVQALKAAVEQIRSDSEKECAGLKAQTDDLQKLLAAAMLEKQQNTQNLHEEQSKHGHALRSLEAEKAELNKRVSELQSGLALLTTKQKRDESEYSRLAGERLQMILEKTSKYQAVSDHQSECSEGSNGAKPADDAAGSYSWPELLNMLEQSLQKAEDENSTLSEEKKKLEGSLYDLRYQLELWKDTAASLEVVVQSLKSDSNNSKNWW